MPAKKHQTINLLPQKEFERTVLGRILKWALSSFRVIVLLTEMCVMSAFLSRFWLDARNSDLNEILLGKKAAVESFSEIETEFRDTQKKLEFFEKIDSFPPVFQEIKSVASTIHPAITLTGISRIDNSLQITGKSGSEETIDQLITNLTALKNLTKIELASLVMDKENNSLSVFTVKAQVKN